MNYKIEITQKVLETLGMETTENRIRKTIPVWWYSTRKKDSGGLRLTEQGFEALTKAEIKSYRIQFDEPIHPTNQLIIWLDHFIDCPFYLDNKEIYVFSEKMAVQLVLFSGNIYKFSKAKARA
jgi:hypothetical protein